MHDRVENFLAMKIFKQTTNKHVNHKGFTIETSGWKMLHCNKLSFESKRFQKALFMGGKKWGREKKKRKEVSSGYFHSMELK